MGIYAPITKPAAAESIPKKALELCAVLKKSMKVIKSEVEDTDPTITIPKALRISEAPRRIPPSRFKITIPAARRIPVIMHAEIEAAQK